MEMNTEKKKVSREKWNIERKKVVEKTLFKTWVCEWIGRWRWSV